MWIEYEITDMNDDTSTQIINLNTVCDITIPANKPEQLNINFIDKQMSAFALPTPMHAKRLYNAFRECLQGSDVLLAGIGFIKKVCD